MRLVDGVLEQEGRVEVCVSEVWGSICGTGWNAIDGYVVCKQLGFDDAGWQINFFLMLNAELAVHRFQHHYSYHTELDIVNFKCSIGM